MIIGSDFYKWLKIFGVPTGGGPPPSGALLAVNNLSDVANDTTSIENLGLGRPGILIINDADFAAGGGTYTLTNPPPIFVVMDATTPGRILKLPAQNQVTSLQGSQSIEFITSPSSEPINIHNGADVLVFQVAPDSAWRAIPNDRTSVAGAWEFLGIVQTINGNKTGNVELASDPHVIYVAPSGSDVPAENDGSILFPYQTLGYALSTIVPLPTELYEINMAPSIYTEVNLVLKPNVFINGNQSQLTVSGAVSLDVDWILGGFLYLQNFSSLSLPATVTLDFNLLQAPFALVNISDCVINSTTTLNVIGKNDSGAIFLSRNNFGTTNQISYGITNCYGAIEGGAATDLTITNTSDTAGGSFSIAGMTILGDFTVTTSSNAGMSFFDASSRILGNSLYQMTGTGALIAKEKGVSHDGDITLDGNLVNFSSDTLTSLPLLVNGAEYLPDSIGDAMRANRYFNPVNYAPVAGPPGLWVEDSITGNLAGIDAALAASISVPPAYAEAYFQGNVTPTTFSAAATPTKVLATYVTGEIENFTQVGGTFTYTGVSTRTVQMSATLTATYDGTGQNTSFYITKNGVPLAKSKQSAFIDIITPAHKPLPVQAKTVVVTGDTFELWVANEDNTNAITVFDCNFGIEGINASLASAGISPSYAEMYFQDNVTPTAVAAANTPVKIEATYSADMLKDFTHLDGTLTYHGSLEKAFVLEADLTATYDGTSQNTSFYIAVNGTVVAKSKQKTFIGPVTPADQSNPCQALVSLTTGNTIEVWVENNDNANDPIVTDFNFLVQSIDAIGVSPNQLGLAEIIFVDGINGSDTNPGTIASPLQSYEAARLLAVSRNPQYGAGQTIVVTTTIAITGNMTISPYVSVVGFGKYCTIIGMSGSIVLDAAWGSTPFAEANISNLAFVAQSINFVFNTYTDSSIVRFENCSYQLLNAGPTATFTGSDGSGNTNGEYVIFVNCTLDEQPGIPEPQFISDNVNLWLINTSVSNLIDASVTSATIAAKLLIQNALGVVGDINLTATSTGTLTTEIMASDTAGATLTVNGTSNTVSIDASSYQFGSIVFSGGASFANIKGSIPQLIYIDQLTGDDSNSGTINYPLQNYEAARLLAIARGASDVFEFTVVVIGNQNIAGDMVLSANVNIQGYNPNYQSGFLPSGDVVIDPNWGLTVDAYCTIKDVYIYLGGTDYIFTFPNARPFSFLKFVNCAFNTGGFITITGTGTTGGIENVTFENCTVDFLNYTPGFIAENVNLYLINTDLTVSDITFTASSATVLEYILAINDARFYTDNITVVTNNTSTLKAYVNACNTMGKTLTIDGLNNTVIVDSTSYMFTLALLNGATLADLVLPTKTDGMTNSSYIPANYTPTGDTAYGADTLTGNLRGIDEALPQVVIGGIAFSSSVGATTVSVVESHEVKLGNIVVATLRLAVTAPAGLVTINTTKSFGGIFASADQAIGSGVCSRTPPSPVGDDSVRIVQGVLPTAFLQFILDINANTNYIASFNFTYEVT